MQFASRPELSCFSSGRDQNCLASSREARQFRATVTIWKKMCGSRTWLLLLLFASERISFRMVTVKGIAWKTTKIRICKGIHVDVYDFALIRVSALSGQLNVNTLYRQNILSLCWLTFLFWLQGLCSVRQPGFGQALNCASAYFLQLILSSCALHHLKH